jgi:hypothetical protein
MVAPVQRKRRPACRSILRNVPGGMFGWMAEMAMRAALPLLVPAVGAQLLGDFAAGEALRHVISSPIMCIKYTFDAILSMLVAQAGGGNGSTAQDQYASST